MTRASGRGSRLYVSVLQRAAEHLGVPFAPLLDAVGIKLEGATDEEDTWFPREAVYRLWQKLSDAAVDPDLGLHVAEFFAEATDMAGVLEYAARNAPTLGDAFRRVERYGRLVHDGAEFSYVRDGETGSLAYSLPDLPEGPNRHAAEWAAASWVLKGQQMTGRPVVPLAVTFRHRAPPRTDEHDRIFGLAPVFSAERTEVRFSGEDLDAPVIGADAGLGAVLDKYAAELIGRLPDAKSVEDRARHYLARVLSSGGDPSLQAIARSLGMSPRTLQRRLREENVSHRELVEDMRHRLALRYVEDGKLSIGEIAFLLGFSEPSAFLRAFRRWTGTSPGRLRAQQAA